MAVVERAEREVVVEFGVPLVLVSIKWWNNVGENSRGLGRSIGVGRRVGHINQSGGSHGIASFWLPVYLVDVDVDHECLR
jgi:hypothetical protein